MSQNNNNNFKLDIPLKAIPDKLLNIKFNTEALEEFIKTKGIVLEHWAALPSPIGLKDRGDYRRVDSLDTIEENGFIYKKIGEFIGVITNNTKKNDFKAAEGGIFDNSTCRLVMSKKYTKKEQATYKDDVSLLPGDRIYVKDLKLEVDNYQRVQYNPTGIDVLQFPAVSVSFLQDSQGVEYTYGIHFTIDGNGNIQWINGQKNPGIDPETGKGRVYSIRYKYNAFWYVQEIINEIRITNTKDPDSPTRLPYHAILQREYVYHVRNRGDNKNTNQAATETSRTNKAPEESLVSNSGATKIKVDIRSFE